MTTHDRYVTETPRETWNVPVSGDARFTWEYDEGRARLLALYQKGKDKQWDAQTRIDWSLEVDKYNVLGLGEESCPIYGSPTFEQARPEGQGRDVPAPRRLAVQPVPARRAGRDDLLGAHRRERARPGREVLRQHPDDGRGAPRRDVCTFPAGEGPARLPDQPAFAGTFGHHAVRQPLGHALPRHAGAHRRSRPRRVRAAARHHDQPAAQADPQLRHAGRGAPRRVRADGAEGRLRRPDRQPSATSARSSSSRRAT